MPFYDLIGVLSCLAGACLALVARNKTAAVWALVAAALVVVHAGPPSSSGRVSPEPVTCRLWES